MFWVCIAAIVLLVAAPILALVCDNKIVYMTVLLIGEILAAIGALPVIFLKLFSK